MVKKSILLHQLLGTKQLFEVNFPGLTRIAITVKQITDGDFDVNGIVGFTGTSVLVTQTTHNMATEVFSYDLKAKILETNYSCK